MRKFGENQGITLIALVITIIVMLILVGVTLSMISGENGILGKAEKAVNVTNESMIKEETEMAIAEKMMDYYADGEYSGKSLFEYMAENLTGYVTPSGATISCGSDGLITYMDEKDNTVFLQMNENGNVEVIGTQNSGGEIRDSIKPIVKVDSTTTNSITFTATDGMGVVAYAVTETEDEPSDWTDIEKSKKFTETVSGKATNKTYYIWAKDNAGNISNPVKAVTSAIDVASSDNVDYEVVWSGVNATVTFSTTSKFTLETSTNDIDWSTKNPITVEGGTQIYVRLTDTINAGTSYAIAKPTFSYNVKYNGNGSTSGSMENSTHEYGTESNLTSNSFSRTGYTFSGWNTKSDGTGTSYSNGVSISKLGTSKGNTVTLYAQWKARTDVYAVATNVSSTGYDVYVYNVSTTAIPKLYYVSFATWTEYNAQDDLVWSHEKISSCLSGTTAHYRVNISSHNNEKGSYHTHIYFRDSSLNVIAGAWATVDVSVP